MTEGRTSEFDHNNNNNNSKKKKKTTSKSTTTEELGDGLSGLCFYGGDDDKGGIFEEKGEKSRKKKMRICEMGWLRDPLVVVGSDIMLMILSCLDARSVALCLLVSCGWRAVASSDRIWSSKINCMCSVAETIDRSYTILNHSNFS